MPIVVKHEVSNKNTNFKRFPWKLDHFCKEGNRDPILTGMIVRLFLRSTLKFIFKQAFYFLLLLNILHLNSKPGLNNICKFLVKVTWGTIEAFFYQLKVFLHLFLVNIDLESRQQHLLNATGRCLKITYSWRFLTARLRWRGLMNGSFVVVVVFVVVLGNFFWIPRKRWTFAAVLAGISRK